MGRWKEDESMRTPTRGSRLPQLFTPIGDHDAPPTYLARELPRTDPAPRRTAGSAELLPPKAAGATASSLLPGPLTAPYPAT
jgi:hypothetical protein